MTASASHVIRSSPAAAQAPEAALAQVQRVLRLARGRLWWERLAPDALWPVIVGAAGFAGWAVAARLGWWPAAWDTSLVWGLAAIGVITIVTVVRRRPSAVATARVVDLRGETGDALATACEFAPTLSQPWSVVQVRAAARRAAAVDVTVLLPWLVPAPLGGAALALALAAAAVLVPGAVLRGQSAAVVAHGLRLDLPAPQVRVVTAAELLGADTLALLRADAALLADVEAQVQDAPTRAWLGQVRQVVQDVATGKLDRRAALEKLAELEAARPAPPEKRQADQPGTDGAAQDRERAGDAERDRDRAVQKAMSEAVQAGLQQAPKGELREEMKKAAEKGDLGALAKLVEKLAERDMSDKELEGWVKTAEKIAKALGVNKTPKEFQELAEKVRRLEDKRRAEGGLSQADQRRLDNARRALEALRREHGDVAGAQPQLQRLERGAKAAADEMRRQQQQRAQQRQQGGAGAQDEARRQQQDREHKSAIAEQFRRAADEMRREAHGQQQRQAGRVGDARLRDLRESLRRAGERSAGRQDFERKARGEKGERDQAQRDGDLKDDGGQRDKGRSAPGGREQAERDAQERQQRKDAAEAGERKGDKPDGLGDAGLQRPPNGPPRPDDDPGRGGGAKPGQGGKMRLGQGGLPDSTPMRDRGGNEVGGGDAKEGSGYGRGAGEQGEGAGEARGKGAARTEKVRGAEGDGPTIKRTFVDAARRGFARTGWRDVYRDYADVAEEMIDKESLPPGRKAVVRRYFDLIRPRAAPPGSAQEER